MWKTLLICLRIVLQMEHSITILNTTMIPEELKKLALQQMIDEGIISLKIYKYREPGEFTEKIWERYISLH